MLQILLGSILLSLVHALIPNHWLPLVAISKAEKWSRRETLAVTAITGSAHTISTILLGIIVGLVGYKLSATSEFITRIAAPLVLIGIGVIYLAISFNKDHTHNHIDDKSLKNRSKLTIILSLSAAMFFSPCIEIEAYFFTAGSLGWPGITAVSVIYYAITVMGMVLFVNLALKGIEKVDWHFMEHHEKKITGLILIVLGLFAYFVHI